MSYSIVRWGNGPVLRFTVYGYGAPRVLINCWANDRFGQSSQTQAGHPTATIGEVMENLTRYPWLMFAAAFVALWLASVMGSWLRRRNPSAKDEKHEDDLSIILGATLTLLALIIGFSISMASSRYDQRKNLEEAEANAIGTEMLRADLLPPADAANVRSLLSAYLDQRILFYINRDDTRQPQIDQSTSQLQTDLWVAVRGPAAAQPTPVMALVLAGMNDVINSQGYTQAAFWNRLPVAV